MIDLSVGSFVQLISLDQQTCLVEVHHSENREGYFYFIEGDLYNAVCGDLEGEEAAIEMISWERARINIDTNANMDGVERKIEKGLLALLMESTRRRDETEWENRFKSLEESEQDNEEIFSAVTVHNDKKIISNGDFEEGFGEYIEACEKHMGDALLSAVCISLSDGKALGSFKANSDTAGLFQNITASLWKVLENTSPESLGRYYILGLENDKTFFSFSHDKDKYQWGIVFDGSKIKLGLFLNAILPKIIKDFEESMTKSADGSSFIRHLFEEFV